MVKLTQLRRPFTVAVVVERTLPAARRAIAASFRAGADAVELNLASLRTFAYGRQFFDSGPIYTTCRRAPFMRVYGRAFDAVPVRTDSERIELQLAAVSAGAAGIDIEADTFDQCPSEWSTQRNAVRRQREIVAAAHRLGAAVIFSWHPPHPLGIEDALYVAHNLEDRGADFIKMVVRVRNPDEAFQALGVSVALERKIRTPFVFLPLGPGAERYRPLVTAFGSSYLLARPPVGANHLAVQIPVNRARRIVEVL